MGALLQSSGHHSHGYGCAGVFLFCREPVWPEGSLLQSAGRITYMGMAVTRLKQKKNDSDEIQARQQLEFEEIARERGARKLSHPKM